MRRTKRSIHLVVTLARQQPANRCGKNTFFLKKLWCKYLYLKKKHFKKDTLANSLQKKKWWPKQKLIKTLRLYIQKHIHLHTYTYKQHKNYSITSDSSASGSPRRERASALSAASTASRPNTRSCALSCSCTSASSDGALKALCKDACKRKQCLLKLKNLKHIHIWWQLL